MAAKDKVVLIGGAIIYRRLKGENPMWFITKTRDQKEWEIPKTVIRRGESSVRGVIRMMSEQGGLRAKVLEEVGRSGGATKINDKPVTQRTIYYLMLAKGQDNVLGFEDIDWLPYPKAHKKLSKRDQNMLETAKEMLKEIDRNRKARKKREAAALK